MMQLTETHFESSRIRTPNIDFGLLDDEPDTMAPYQPDKEMLKAFLLQAVERAFEIETIELLSPTRGRASSARARQVLMYLAHVGCGMTLTDVGLLFQRDRTTVAHACNVIEECREDKEFDKAIELLECIVDMALSLPRHGRGA